MAKGIRDGEEQPNLYYENLAWCKGIHEIDAAIFWGEEVMFDKN